MSRPPAIISPSTTPQPATVASPLPRAMSNTPSRARDQATMRVSLLNLLYDPPVENCELKPFLMLKDGLGNKFMVEREDEVVFTWSRGQKRVCALPRCHNAASMQFLPCVKAKMAAHRSYFCSQACLRQAWPSLRHEIDLHTQRIAPDERAQWAYDDSDSETEASEASSSSASAADPSSPSAPSSASPVPNGKASKGMSAICRRYPARPTNIWAEVSRRRCYTPNSSDVGRALRLEVHPILGYENDGSPILGPSRALVTGCVLSAPDPPPQRPLKLPETPPQMSPTGHPFRAVCYNVLAETYATRQLYPYTPMWALTWEYRKWAILKHLLSLDAEVICLQEVQADAYETFFKPELFKVGYDGIYERKTRQAPEGKIDGCAVFYKSERFALLEKHTLSFDEVANSYLHNRRQKRRVARGNIAVITVLEDLMPDVRMVRARKRHVCVANTHIFWDPEFSDVKLWQTFMLCQHLERNFLSRNLPIVLCGDFNSLTDSSVYQLLTTGCVPPRHPVFQKDPCQILPAQHNIVHRLGLLSAYAACASGKEPPYTNYTGHFKGVLDYILFSQSHLMCTGVLQVDDLEQVSKHTALPSPQYPSDHVSLMAHLRFGEAHM